MPEAETGLEPSGSESWSERLKARVRLEAPADVHEGVKALLRSAWEAA
jgi:hypothetical protein